MAAPTAHLHIHHTVDVQLRLHKLVGRVHHGAVAVGALCVHHGVGGGWEAMARAARGLCAVGAGPLRLGHTSPGERGAVAVGGTGCTGPRGHHAVGVGQAAQGHFSHAISIQVARAGRLGRSVVAFIAVHLQVPVGRPKMRRVRAHAGGGG